MYNMYYIVHVRYLYNIGACVGAFLGALVGAFVGAFVDAKG